MMLRDISNRWLYLAAVLVISAMFGGALYIQHVLHHDPCPLCMIQRFIFIAMGVLFAIATLHNPKRTGAKVYAALISLVALSGVAVASRHIWIQHLPEDEVPACGPGLDYMLDNFPMAEVLKELMHGSGECAEKGWTFLTLNLPEWSLIWYALLGAWAVLIAVKASRA
jgi:disulfide bond formation protein DsbB